MLTNDSAEIAVRIYSFVFFNLPFLNIFLEAWQKIPKQLLDYGEK